jgi:molybdopterin-biosynthesis enzyme MoeA-like protein
MKQFFLVAVALVAVAGVAPAQDSCTTLYSHGNHDVILCSVTVDGKATFTKTELTASSASTSHISEALYLQLMKEDTAELQAHNAQLKAIEEQRNKERAEREAEHAALVKAAKIHSKKECSAAGFVWQHGSCSPK